MFAAQLCTFIMFLTLAVTALATPEWGEAPGQEIQAQQLEITGDFEKPRPMTEADRMRVQRQQLEEQTNIAMKKRIEKMRIKRELEIEKKMQAAFEEQLKSLDSL